MPQLQPASRGNRAKQKPCSHCAARLLFWYARRDSNPQPSEPESDALSNCATGASFNVLFYYSNLSAVCKGEFSHTWERRQVRRKSVDKPPGFYAIYPIDRWSLAGYTNSNLGTMEYRQKGNEEKSTCGDTAQRAPAGGKGRGRPEGTWSWSRAPSARRFRGALGRDGGARHSAGVSGNLYAQRPRAARLWVKQGGTTKANRSRPGRLASGAFFDAWTLQPGDGPAPSGAKNQTKRRKSQ